MSADLDGQRIKADRRCHALRYGTVGAPASDEPVWRSGEATGQVSPRQPDGNAECIVPCNLKDQIAGTMLG